MPDLATSESKTVLTFGYGNRKNYDAFLSCLREFSVTCVVDVRLKPRAWSRMWYGDALQKLCTSENIQYVSKSSLGNLSGSSHWIPPEPEAAKQTLCEVAEMLETGNILNIFEIGRAHV